jgi:hypothetical protein
LLIFGNSYSFARFTILTIDGGTLCDNKKSDQAKDQKMASSQLLDTDKCTAVRTGAYDPLSSRGAQTISKVGGNKKLSLNQEVNGYV